MFEQINARAGEAPFRELLEYAAYFEPENVEEIIRIYSSPGPYELYACEDEGEYVGLIGLRMDSATPGVLEIIHLAVAPEYRLNGYGRGLVLQALGHKEPQTILAVTDEEGAQFFRSIGFQITGFSDVPGGPEQFRCVYLVNDEEPED